MNWFVLHALHVLRYPMSLLLLQASLSLCLCVILSSCHCVILSSRHCVIPIVSLCHELCCTVLTAPPAKLSLCQLRECIHPIEIKTFSASYQNIVFCAPNCIWLLDMPHMGVRPSVNWTIQIVFKNARRYVVSLILPHQYDISCQTEYTPFPQLRDPSRSRMWHKARQQ